MVAPLAGAWIETHHTLEKLEKIKVAPLAGAWIETFKITGLFEVSTCRSPRGSVD